MADKTENEHLDDPGNIQSKNFANKPIVIDATETISHNQVTRYMEAHHHTHSAHGKKTLKDYFWEFLMLFLAVFCGFLAEYQLEHKIERERGAEYLRSFYDDLNTNLTTCAQVINDNKKKIEPLNNMEACYDSVSKNWKNSSCLYGLMKNSRSVLIAHFAEGTMEQLKNAGGFRLLKKEDRDSILLYDKEIRIYKNTESTVIQESQDNLRDDFKKLVNFKANNYLDSASYATEIPYLFYDNKALINELFNDLLRYKRSLNFQTNNLGEIEEKTNRLKAYFKAKYHFE